MNNYRLSPMDDDTKALLKTRTAEVFMEAYGREMAGGGHTFGGLMDNWMKRATGCYIMTPRTMTDVHSIDEAISHAKRDEVKLVIVFPDLSVAVCGHDGGVATDVQSMMGDWWETGNGIFKKHVRETDQELN